MSNRYGVPPVEDVLAALEPIKNTLRHVRYTVNPDAQHPRVAEIHNRQRDRHDHTDETPRCGNCGGHLPKVEQGHNRTLCPNCSTPQTYWVE